MISFITSTETKTDRSVVSTCLRVSPLNSTGLSGALVSGTRGITGVQRFGNERPTKALAGAVAAVAQAAAYVGGSAANGAGEGRQKKQQHVMWAFRGHEPWRDPA